MSACGSQHEGMDCTRPAGNHPRCTGFDEELDDFRDWPNPTYIDPRPSTPEKAKQVKDTAVAATPPDERVDGFPAGLEGSEQAAERWTPEQRDEVYAAVERVCRARAFRQGGEAGHDEFTADAIWDELAGSVPVTKGLTSVLAKASRNGLCDNTGKTVISTRGGRHDHGQRLTVWYSLAGRR